MCVLINMEIPASSNDEKQHYQDKYGACLNASCLMQLHMLVIDFPGGNAVLAV